MQSWIIQHPGDAQRVAGEFLQATRGETLFALYGPMGVGKTTFIRAVAECLEVTDEVTSPTFAIVNEYATRSGERLYHFDFYRVNTVQEALDFGVEEYLYSGARCLIEWPELIEPLLEGTVVVCRLNEQPDGTRLLEIEKTEY